ncbi:MAG: cell division protein ZapD [Kangiellaceae bacterium]|nr:cell division protein ZapD [Kangiellaceae bacterium]
MPELAENILYEHPLNEHIRTYLRLEHLFNTQLQLQQTDTIACQTSALQNLWQILDCLDRGDIKGELLKELEQQRNHFRQLQDSPYIDEIKLRRFLEQLEQLFNWISHYQGKFGQQLRKDRFIELIKHRIRIPGGSCSFDLPELHQFLHLPFAQREEAFNQWFKHLDGLYQCIRILLRLFRENGQFNTITSDQGVFQYNFDKKINPQMLRIKLPVSAPYFPEISGSKHCFTIRFLTPEQEDTIAYNQPVSFELAIC